MAAALCSVSSLSRKLTNIRLTYSILRCVATNSSEENVTSEPDTEPLTGVPSRKRDPLAVLRILAGTVKPTPFAPSPDFFDDPQLLPISEQKQAECRAARLSGQRAADAVWQKFKGPMRKPNPPWKKIGKLGHESEEDILDIIASFKVKEAIELYERLQKQGVKISLETQNALLDLVGFYGTLLEDESVSSQINDIDQNNPIEEDKPSNEEDESKDDEEYSLMRRYPNTWRIDNYAEQMFAKMDNKNATTYNAMILAALKHSSIERGFELFWEMRKKNLQASIFTYNMLFNKSPLVYGKNDDLLNGIEELIAQMKTAPEVTPTFSTYIALLKLCVLQKDGTSQALEIIRDIQHKQIEITLGMYSLLLRAEYYSWKFQDGDQKVPERNCHLLQIVVGQLEKLDTLPPLQHVSDVRFFNTAMSVAFQCKDTNAAHRLYTLAECNDTALLGEKRGLFYAKYVATLARGNQNAEIVYHVFKQLVPNKIMPYPWVINELFLMIERQKRPKLIPQLYEDMKRLRIPLTSRNAQAIFEALSRNTDPRDFRDYLDVMEDVLLWVHRFGFALTPFMIANLVKQYCAGGLIEKARETMKMFDEYNHFPTYSSLISFLNYYEKHGDAVNAQNILEKCAKFGYSVPKRRLTTVMDQTRMSVSTRLHIMKLFDNVKSLEKAQENRKYGQL